MSNKHVPGGIGCLNSSKQPKFLSLTKKMYYSIISSDLSSILRKTIVPGGRLDMINVYRSAVIIVVDGILRLYAIYCCKGYVRFQTNSFESFHVFLSASKRAEPFLKKFKFFTHMQK